MPEEGNVEPTGTVETTQTEVTDSTTETVTKDDSKTFSAEYVQELRQEAAKNRVERQKAAKQVEDLMAKLQQFEDSKLSDADRAKKEFEETRTRAEVNEARAKEAELKFQLALAAKEHNISDVKAAVKLADRELIDFDSDGSISNLPEVIEALRNEYSSLFNAAAPSAPKLESTNPAKKSSAYKWTRDDLKKLSPQKIVELQEAGELKHLLGGR